MAIIMLLNLKGGLAKTTSAVAIAECLAAAGHRTLLIDAHHQCMASELPLTGLDGHGGGRAGEADPARPAGRHARMSNG